MQASRRTRVLLAERLAATQLAMANVNLARKIKAPISGVIVAEMAEQARLYRKEPVFARLTIRDKSRYPSTCERINFY